MSEDSNLKVYQNQEMIYEKIKENTIENTIQKMNILGNRIEKILEINENVLCNEEATLLLFQSVKSIYQELILLREDVNVLKEVSTQSN